MKPLLLAVAVLFVLVVQSLACAPALRIELHNGTTETVGVIDDRVIHWIEVGGSTTMLFADELPVLWGDCVRRFATPIVPESYVDRDSNAVQLRLDPDGSVVVLDPSRSGDGARHEIQPPGYPAAAPPHASCVRASTALAGLLPDEEDRWLQEMRSHFAGIAAIETASEMMLAISFMQMEVGIMPPITKGTTLVLGHGVDLKYPLDAHHTWRFRIRDAEGSESEGVTFLGHDEAFVEKTHFVKHLTDRGALADGLPPREELATAEFVIGMGEQLLYLSMEHQACMWVPLRMPGLGR